MKKFRPIAIHLPQFHPTPENDQWWGKGFTEWTNVTKSVPLFKGHYQPRLPADLGFYDLRLEEARLEQEILAKQYGIYGFCYYHYWFNGKRILHEPVERKLKNPKEDLPFMLCWANENWTRRWDGKDQHILMKQDYSKEDDIQHIKYLIPIFKDPRYIKIKGRPVFAVYRSTLFPDISKTIHTWKQEAAKEGLDLYICRFETFGTFGNSYMDPGFDAGVEFPPMNEQMHLYAKKKMQRDASGMSYRLKYHYYKLNNNNEKLKELKELSKNRIDYGDYVKFLKQNYRYPQDYCYYPGVCPSWDNTARNKKNPFIFLDSTPKHFKDWMTFHRDHFKPHSPEENFIFINAWNEWAEGNHLEPCHRWGTAYLEAVRDVFGVS